MPQGHWRIDEKIVFEPKRKNAAFDPELLKFLAIILVIGIVGSAIGC